MANYAQLKSAVNAVITTNGNNEITGAILNNILNTIIDTIGGNYTFAGVATPSTSVGSPDANVFWIGGAGTYTNFGGSITIAAGNIGIFTYNGSFARTELVLGAAFSTGENVGNVAIDGSPIHNSEGLPKSGGTWLAINNARTVQVNSLFSNTGYLTPSGTINTNSTFSHSELIRVWEGCKVIYTGFGGNTNVTDIGGYNANKVWSQRLLIGNSSELYNEVVTIPSGINYICISCANSTHAKWVPETSVAIQFPAEVVDGIIGGIESTLNILSTSMLSAEGDISTLKNYVSVLSDDPRIEILPTSMDLVETTNISGTESTAEKPWYPWRCASCTWDNAKEAFLFSVDSGNTHRYGGLRTDLMWSTISLDTSLPLFVKCDVYPIVSDGARCYLMITDQTSESLYNSVTANAWNTITFEYSADTLQGLTLSRFLIFAVGGNSINDNTARSFYLRNLEIWQKVNENNIPLRLDALDERVTAIEGMFAGKRLAVIGDSISTSGRFKNYSLKVLSGDVGNQIQTGISYLDVYDSEGVATNKTCGGVTLTDSMIGTVQTFTPVSSDVGKTFGINSVFNSSTSLITWSEILANKLGMNLIGNAQWSGASVCSGQINTYVGSYAWSDYTIAACSARTDAGIVQTPDYIIIYRGVNDMTHNQGGTGYSRIDPYDIAQGYPTTDYDGAHYQYRNACLLLVKKLREKYPLAKILFATLNVFKRVNYSAWPTNNNLYTLPALNTVIRDIANETGCGLIELDKDGCTFENYYPNYTNESTTSTHPNQAGHAQIARKAVADLEKYIKDFEWNV